MARTETAPAARAGRFARAIAPAHLALILTVVLVWAYNFIAAKVALAELSPLLLTALRFAVVGAVLLPFVPRPERFLPVLVISCCLATAHFALMFWALALATKVAPLAITVQLNRRSRPCSRRCC